MGAWVWFCVAILASTSALLVVLACFWGREVGVVGYAYWLTVAALPLAGIGALFVSVA